MVVKKAKKKTEPRIILDPVKVFELSAQGYTKTDISREMGFHIDTWYEAVKRQPEVSEAYNKGRESANHKLETFAYKQATILAEKADHPSVALLIFLLKARCGYRDRVEVSGDPDRPLLIAPLFSDNYSKEVAKLLGAPQVVNAP